MQITQKLLNLNLVAKIFSIAFQPILMSIFGLVLVFTFNDTIRNYHDTDTELLIYALCISFTIIFPIIVFGIFLKLGLVTDVNLTQRKERIVPFFLSIILFGIFYYLVRTDERFHTLILPIIFGTLVITFIANNLTLFWKISIHSLGVSSVLGTLSGLAMVTNTNHLPLIIGLTAVVLVIGISRVLLKRHTSAQVVAGTLLGFSGTFFAILHNIYI